MTREQIKKQLEQMKDSQPEEVIEVMESFSEEESSFSFIVNSYEICV